MIFILGAEAVPLTRAKSSTLLATWLFTVFGSSPSFLIFFQYHPIAIYAF
ncbi:MAG: hypothetical protein LBC70_00865 [Chitinispirillales bacterium]|nr:hypothetical protein [Chitinispirillales bacterium]